ncbi:hypothetical protein GCM10008018_29930 [Paenibacillus marchantiophytorum]|uniref:Uncharacterized protein n=1 Tax=Paenibacillus marchantiophytorum TaxID=1619310 RepID=A0ABQ1ER03_9BACL|nr:hypothetical protein [Paenibacillus marchantiophytorum]GFZ82181.1 hypothetical protein GCM10008018_29930 [Paenibacillus marchantiophytorum]
MLDIQLAKPVMENEEGMNHLWVQFPLADFMKTELAEVSIQLPDGLYRSPNLNGYKENMSKLILVNLERDKDVLIEIYTQSAINIGEAAITVGLRYTNCLNNIKEIHHSIPIHFVHEDESEHLAVNDQVIGRLKELLSPIPQDKVDFLSVQSKIMEIRHNEYSYLEKKYRVDC